MRSLVLSRAAWLLSIALALPGLSSWALADPPLQPPVTAPPTATVEPASTPEVIFQRALDLERKRNWQAAIRTYEEALDQWPSHVEFSHRRRLCEIHYRLVRRYQDQSFRNVLLRLPQDKALGLYDELLERIESHYVDPVPFEPLLRRGLDNLEVALRDPEFLRLNALAASPEEVSKLRNMLRARRDGLKVPDRAAAQWLVLAVCGQAAQTLRMGPAPVILEFTYGACDVLDDYTSYLTPDKLEDLYAMIDGNFVGLGIELKLDTEGLRLVGVIRRGPAWEAGLKVGDQIIKVAGQPVRGLSLDEAAGRLQGSEGTAIDLTVLHSDGSSQGFKIIRRHVEVESVAQAKIVDQAGGIGYIQLTGFQKNSAEELDKAVASLKRQGMKSLVLDLRGNPGGLLNVAVDIAEKFIDRGVIVSTRGRAAGQTQIYRARSKALWTMPMTVLIDRDSASASEILAGALKDHNRAVVMGQRSYGKGSVQSIFSLRSAPAGLKLTTAKFYSPNDRPYSEQGVEPHIAIRVDAKPAETKAGDERDETAADLAFGDPEHDPVLEQAILHVRKSLNASR
ncbi:S41 family peptidase [Singulisphaera rosea]